MVDCYMPCDDEDDDDDCCDGGVEVTIVVVVVVSPMCTDDSVVVVVVAVVDVGECDETVVEMMNFSPDGVGDTVGDGYSGDCCCHGVTMRKRTDS